MSIGIDLKCLECYLKKNLQTARSLGTEEQAIRFAKAVMKLYIEAPDHVSAPYFGPQVADLLHEMYGLEIDRYHQDKMDSNRFVMERMEDIRQRIQSAEDPIYTGLRFAILGNYLDFPALQGNISFDTLEDMLDKAAEIQLDSDTYQNFLADLSSGSRMLYITDNAGEIGFDRLLAETIAQRYPNLSITFCVRGDIAANDATRDDARAVGITFPVIDNGNRVAGTQLELCSEECLEAIRSADVILAKGMANTETMFGCGYNVYYAFLVKCIRFQRLFQQPMFTPMLVKERK